MFINVINESTPGSPSNCTAEAIPNSAFDGGHASVTGSPRACGLSSGP